MEQLTRRGFVAGAAGAAAAAGAAGARAAFAVAGVPDEWDDEADFVVLGSGTALTGALRAAAEGMSVLVLEKAGTVGGTTILSGGQVWVPCNAYSEEADDPELARKYMEKVAAGLSTDAIIDAYIQNAAPMAEFVAEQAGVEWSVSPRIDYHAQWEGAARDKRSIAVYVDGKASGANLIEPEAAALEALGGRVLTGVAAKRLVTRPTEDGRQEVLGVVAEGPDGELAVKAGKAVLIGTGGFSFDTEMLREFHPMPAEACMCVAGSTGDGIKMAQAAGAALTNMCWGWGLIQFKEQAEENFRNGACSTNAALYAYESKPGSIFVNRQGKRFMDEASDYDSTWYGFQGQSTTGEMELTNSPAWYVCDQSVREAICATGMGFFGVGLDEDLPEWAYQADTVAELAEKIGVDPDALVAQIDKYNADVEAGQDTEFHRGESAFETYNLMNSGPTLGKLEQPPFYAAQIIPTYQGTKGGIKVDEEARALDPFGNAVPRLYACGNTTGVGGPGKYYTGAGGTNGPGMVMAYIAAGSAAGLEAWE